MINSKSKIIRENVESSQLMYEYKKNLFFIF